MVIPATLLSASCLGLILLFLVIWNARQRLVELNERESGAPSEGTLSILNHRMRVVANFTEYTPFALILLGALEVTNLPRMLIYGLAFALVLGRGLHAWGFSRNPGTSFGRFYGTLITWAMIAVASLSGLYAALIAA